MLKLLVTGATGFVGTNFIQKLHGKYDITAIVRPTSNTKKIQDCCTLYVHNGDMQDLLNFCKSQKFDGIIHLATSWISQHSLEDIENLISNNITFGVQILEITKQIKAPFFINTSSFGLYCNSINYRPSSLYAATKKAFEDIISYYALTSATIFSHILIYNTYGPNDNAKRLFSLLSQIAQTGKELKMSDGAQIVDITYIDDIVFAFDCLIQQISLNPIGHKNKIYALKNPIRRTLRETVEIFEEVCGKKLNIIWGAREPRELEITIPWEGGDTLQEWEPKISLKSGIQYFVNQTIDTNEGGGVKDEIFHPISHSKRTMVAS